MVDLRIARQQQQPYNPRDVRTARAISQAQQKAQAEAERQYRAELAAYEASEENKYLQKLYAEGKKINPLDIQTWLTSSDYIIEYWGEGKIKSIKSKPVRYSSSYESDRPSGQKETYATYTPFIFEFDVEGKPSYKTIYQLDSRSGQGYRDTRPFVSKEEGYDPFGWKTSERFYKTRDWDNQLVREYRYESGEMTWKQNWGTDFKPTIPTKKEKGQPIKYLDPTTKEWVKDKPKSPYPQPKTPTAPSGTITRDKDGKQQYFNPNTGAWVTYAKTQIGEGNKYVYDPTTGQKYNVSRKESDVKLVESGLIPISKTSYANVVGGLTREDEAKVAKYQQYSNFAISQPESKATDKEKMLIANLRMQGKSVRYEDGLIYSTDKEGVTGVYNLNRYGNEILAEIPITTKKYKGKDLTTEIYGGNLKSFIYSEDVREAKRQKQIDMLPLGARENIDLWERQGKIVDVNNFIVTAKYRDQSSGEWRKEVIDLRRSGLKLDVGGKFGTTGGFEVLADVPLKTEVFPSSIPYRPMGEPKDLNIDIPFIGGNNGYGIRTRTTGSEVFDSGINFVVGLETEARKQTKDIFKSITLIPSKVSQQYKELGLGGYLKRAGAGAVDIFKDIGIGVGVLAAYPAYYYQEKAKGKTDAEISQPILQSKEVQTVTTIGALGLAAEAYPIVGTIAGGGFLGLSTYETIKDPSAENIGKTASYYSLAAIPKVLKKVRPAVRELEIPQKGGKPVKVTMFGFETAKGKALNLVTLISDSKIQETKPTWNRFGTFRIGTQVKFGTQDIYPLLKKMPKGEGIFVASALETKTIAKSVAKAPVTDFVAYKGKIRAKEGIAIYQELLAKTMKSKSKFINKNNLFTPTERLPKEGILDVLKSGREASAESITFGSKSRDVTLAREYKILGKKFKLNKVPRDIELRFETESQSTLATKKILKRFSKRGKITFKDPAGVEKTIDFKTAREIKDTPNAIEAKINGKYEKVYEGKPSGLDSDIAPEYVFGIEKIGKPLNIKGYKITSASEELRGVVQGAGRLRNVEVPSGKFNKKGKPIMEEKLDLFPEDKRVKDIGSIEVTARTLEMSGAKIKKPISKFESLYPKELVMEQLTPSGKPSRAAKLPSGVTFKYDYGKVGTFETITRVSPSSKAVSRYQRVSPSIYPSYSATEISSLSKSPSRSLSISPSPSPSRSPSPSPSFSVSPSLSPSLSPSPSSSSSYSQSSYSLSLSPSPSSVSPSPSLSVSPSPSPSSVSPSPSPSKEPSKQQFPFIDIQSGRKKPMEKPSQGFDVMIKTSYMNKRNRRASTYVRANDEPLNRVAALGMGAEIVDRYSNKAFKLRSVKTKQPIQQRDDLAELWFAKQGKFSKVGSTYVEKGRFGLDSFEEKQGQEYGSAFNMNSKSKKGNGGWF